MPVQCERHHIAVHSETPSVNISFLAKNRFLIWFPFLLSFMVLKNGHDVWSYEDSLSAKNWSPIFAVSFHFILYAKQMHILCSTLCEKNSLCSIMAGLCYFFRILNSKNLDGTHAHMLVCVTHIKQWGWMQSLGFFIVHPSSIFLCWGFRTIYIWGL